MSRRLCVYAKGDTYEQIHTMVGLVSTAASMGWEAHVYLTYGVLWRYVHEEMAEAEVTISTPVVREKYIKGIDSGRIPDLDELFEEARELGGDKVRVYGCTTSVKLLHLPPEKLEMCDALMGHASFLKLAADGELVVT